MEASSTVVAEKKKKNDPHHGSLPLLVHRPKEKFFDVLVPGLAYPVIIMYNVATSSQPPDYITPYSLGALSFIFLEVTC